MVRKILPACIAAVALSGTAFAQSGDVGPSKGNWEVTLSGTGNSDNDFESNALGVTGSAGKYFTDNILGGVRQSVTFSDPKNGENQTNFSTRLFADYVFDLDRWRPFVGVNFGGIYGDGVNDTFAAGPEVGVKYYADRNTFVYAQAEYQITFDSASNADDAADDGQYNYGIGVGFNF